MKIVMVRYRVKPLFVEQNKALIRGVFQELDRVHPSALRYAAFQMPDETQFVHIAATTEAVNPVTALRAFKAFTGSINDRCDEPPHSVELRLMGNYALVGE
jgi:hypothetical protein